MTSHGPVGSISGQQEWEWNRWQAEKRSGEARTAPAADRASENRERDCRERYLASQREIAALEAELERKDRHLQDVIDHYEGLLRKKNRQLNAPGRSASRTGSTSTALSRTARSYWAKVRSYLE